MEELAINERPNLFTRFTRFFVQDNGEESVTPDRRGKSSLEVRTTHQYTVTIRKGVATFDDAMAAAQGLKRGEQQVLNLADAEFELKQKIVDFMCGVNFAQEGTWEEIGDDIYLIVPANGYVEIAPSSPRMATVK